MESLDQVHPSTYRIAVSFFLQHRRNTGIDPCMIVNLAYMDLYATVTQCTLQHHIVNQV